MDLQQQEGWQGMTDLKSKSPPLWANVHPKPDKCLLCHRRTLAFVGGFTPAQGTEELWSPVPPGAAKVKFFALCAKHFRQAKQTQMENVDTYFRTQLAQERMGPAH